MAQEPNPGSASDAIGFALIEHADRIGRSVESTRDALSEQIEQFKELQKWTVDAVQVLQQRVDASIQKIELERQKLEAERLRMQTVQGTFELNAMQAIQNAGRRQGEEIERIVVQALARPLRDIEHGAGHVRQNVQNFNWLYFGGTLFAGIIFGLVAGYLLVIRGQNTMDDRLDRIEQYLAAQQQALAVPDGHAPAHKGKAN